MFLKAGLSRKYSLEQLKYEFGHKLWKAFKAEFPSTALLQFETTIADIAEFEEIRYPDNVLEHGAQMLVDWGPIPAQISASSPPLYKLYPMNLDRLIGELFGASCRHQLFFTTRLKPDVQDMLARDNPVAAQLLGN
jgi:hypothetical protein